MSREIVKSSFDESLHGIQLDDPLAPKGRPGQHLASHFTRPKIADGVFLTPSSHIIGDVEIGPESSIWFNTVLRGDVMPIRVGRRTNIQDGSVVHGTFRKAAATLGDEVSVGHSVILHGCTIGNRVLVGMGSIVMDGVIVEDNCFVGAGSLLTEGKRFPSGHMILGRPAKAIRPLEPAELAFLAQSAQNYLDYQKWYTDTRWYYSSENNKSGGANG
jgi:carbonic anhydrase/acetyltransferase-like protein (isoleucine patch superfamily)